MMIKSFSFLLYLALMVLSVSYQHSIFQFKNIRKKVSNAFLSVGLLTSGFTIQDIANAKTIEGTVYIGNDIQPPVGESTALYVTGVLNAKPPPVLSKRIEISAEKFPVHVILDEDLDGTIEGKTDEKWKRSELPLLLSARFDSDGKAATRSPDDLIGQTSQSIKNLENGWERFEIVLEGRGVAGKFITNKNK